MKIGDIDVLAAVQLGPKYSKPLVQLGGGVNGHCRIRLDYAGTKEPALGRVYG
jgi:hypothetical protein